MATVMAANLSKRLALLDDGRSLPITNLFDAAGDDTADPAEAQGFVCGADREWYAESLADFEPARTQ